MKFPHEHDLTYFPLDMSFKSLADFLVQVKMAAVECSVFSVLS